MGTISYGLYTFFSLIICLIPVLRGTAGEMSIYLYICFPHSAFRVAQMKPRRISKNEEGGSGGPTARWSCNSHDLGCQSLEKANLLIFEPSFYKIYNVYYVKLLGFK